MERDRGRSDLPEAVPAALEAVPNADLHPKYSYSSSSRENDGQSLPLELGESNYDTKADAETTLPKRICGLRRKSFYITLCITLIIIVAALGGGIGGAMAASNNKKHSSSGKNATAASNAPAPSTNASSNTSSVSDENSPTSPRKATALASTSWIDDDGAQNAHLYFQDVAGDLRVRTLKSPDGWSNETSSFGDSFPAKNGTSLAAISWPGSEGNNREIRLYYTNPDGVLCEATSSVGEWTNGNLVSSGFRPSNGSGIAATAHWSGQQQAVYFQNQQGKLERITRENGAWIRNQTLSSSTLDMIEGSGLTSLILTSADTTASKLQVVAQAPDGSIVSQTYDAADDTWLDSPEVVYDSSSISKGTVLAMGDTKRSEDMQQSVSLFFMGTGGTFNELHWDNSTLWSDEPKDLGTGDVESGLTVLIMKEPSLSAYFDSDYLGVQEMQLQDSGNFGLSDFKLA